MNIRIMFSEKVVSYILGKNRIESSYVIKTINEIINIYKLWRYMYQNIQKDICIEIDDIIKEWSYLRMNVFKREEGIVVNKDNLLKVTQKIKSIEKYVQIKLSKIIK